MSLWRNPLKSLKKIIKINGFPPLIHNEIKEIKPLKPIKLAYSIPIDINSKKDKHNGNT